MSVTVVSQGNTLCIADEIEMTDIEDARTHRYNLYCMVCRPSACHSRTIAQLTVADGGRAATGRFLAVFVPSSYKCLCLTTDLCASGRIASACEPRCSQELTTSSSFRSHTHCIHPLLLRSGLLLRSRLVGCVRKPRFEAGMGFFSSGGLRFPQALRTI